MQRPCISQSKIDVDEVARRIVVDGFKTQKTYPQNLVETTLPIPIAKGSRKRIAKRLGVCVNARFHSMYDKAIHYITCELGEE